MLLIKRVSVKNFRSMQTANLLLPQGYLPIVGSNNSGKSNLLRCLNLFFRSEVEPGRLLRLAQDFHNPASKKRKEITITVEFELPKYFTFHRSIKESLQGLLGQSFVISKTYTYSADPSTPGYATSVIVERDGEVLEGGLDDATKVQRFLDLIKFRYQPNHLHPSEVLSSEQHDIQKALITKLRRSKETGGKALDRIFATMSEVAGTLVEPIRQSLKNAGQEVEEFELATPRDFGDLLFSFSPRLQVKGGEKFEALQHGSGIQSYLMYLMLAFLDSRFDSQFGWQQATIWAIEEPESYLHQALQHRLAGFLAALGKGDRFQVLCTTHSDVFTRYAENGVFCRLESGRTALTVMPTRTMSAEAAKRGISPYVHPLLYASQRPLLIVEGKTDRDYFGLAYRLLGRLNAWEIRDIASLDPDARLEGIDGLRTYLQVNRNVLATRPYDAPVLVVVDWNEATGKINQIKKILDAHPTSRVVQWLADDANSQLDRTFTGVERFLSTDLIFAAEGNGILSTKRPSTASFPLSVDRDSLQKVALAALAETRSLAADLNHFRPMLERCDTELRNAIAESERLLAGILI